MGTKVISSEEFERQHPRDKLNRTGRFVNKPRPSLPEVDIKAALTDYVADDVGEQEPTRSASQTGNSATPTRSANSSLPSYVRVKWVTTITNRFDRSFSGSNKAMTQPANTDFFYSKETEEKYISVEAIPTAETYCEHIRKMVAVKEGADKGLWREASLDDHEYAKQRQDGSRHKILCDLVIKDEGGPSNELKYAHSYETSDIYDGVTSLDVRRVEAPEGVPTCKPPSSSVFGNKKPKDFVRGGLRVMWEQDSDGRWLPSADKTIIDMTLGTIELAGRKGMSFKKKCGLLQDLVTDVRSGVLPAHLLPSLSKLITKPYASLVPIDSDVDSLFEYLCLPADKKKARITASRLDTATENFGSNYAAIWKCYRPSSDRLLSCIKQNLESDEDFTANAMYFRLYKRRLPSSVDVEEELFTTMALADSGWFTTMMRGGLGNRYDRFFWPGFDRAVELILDKASMTDPRSQLCTKHDADLPVVAASDLIQNMVNYYNDSSRSQLGGGDYRLLPEEATIERLIDGLFQIGTEKSQHDPNKKQNAETQRDSLLQLLEFSRKPKPIYSSKKYKMTGLFGESIENFSHIDQAIDCRGTPLRETWLTKAIRDSIKGKLDSIRQSGFIVDADSNTYRKQQIKTLLGELSE